MLKNTETALGRFVCSRRRGFCHLTLLIVLIIFLKQEQSMANESFKQIA